MSQRDFYGCRPVVIRVLLGGAVLWPLVAIGLAADKPPRHGGTNSRRSEHVAPQQPKPSSTNSNKNFKGGSGSTQRFQPNFNREPARGNLPPANPGPNRIAYLPEKGDKGKGSGAAPRTSQPDKPVKIEQTPRIERIKPRNNSNPPPQIKPQVKLKIEDRTNSGPPNNSKRSGGNSGVDAQRDSKIHVPKIQPDLKVRTSPNKGEPIKSEHSPREKPVRLKDGATLTRNHHEQTKVHLDKQHRELVANGKATNRVKVVLPRNTRQEGGERLEKLPREALRIPVAKNGKLDPHVAAKLKIRPAREVLEVRQKNGEFQQLAKLRSGQTFKLDRQFQMHRQGDISRRMNLVAGLQHRGGWRHRHFGPISPLYSSRCRSMWYAGPGYCSPYVWYPNWAPWVDWCWWDTCAPIYDPRPIYCQPVYCNPCTPWVAWQFPTWQPLPYVTCGTWVDVAPVVINSGADLQLLATRFVDPGHPEHELGPRFRVWFRNNSAVDLNHSFNVLLLAATDANAFAGLPEAGVQVAGIRAGETQSVDIRLPYAANKLGRDSSGQPIPFTYLNVLVDSHNELPEALENNNGATLIRGDILPVDPASFAADPGASQPNGIIHVAGEGLGPEPGQAMVVIGDQEFQAEILGWFDLGIQIRLPDFELEQAMAADLVIIRGDGAAANPLTIEISPQQSGLAVSALQTTPGPELAPAPPLPEPETM